MKKNKNRIVVFSDLKGPLNNTLKSTIGLAKMLNGDIELFHVRKPSEVVKTESQLSAMRTINREYITIDKKIKSITNSFSKDFGVNISYSFAIGNLKNEIGTYIKEHKPDVIVLQRKKTKVLDFLGDKIAQFVLHQHLGAVFIVDEKKVLEPNKELSLGFLDDGGQTPDIEFMDSLLLHTQKPLKSFRIVENPSDLKTSKDYRDNKTIEFVFEKRDDSIKNLSNYLTINNINLLCVGRSKGNPNKKNENLSINSNIKTIVGNLSVPLLLMGHQNLQ
jgi:hypothetical protein